MRNLKLLKDCEIKSINVSLDTLKEKRFKTITLRNNFKNVIQNIQELLKNGFSIKINAVLMKGVNDDEIIDFINFTNFNSTKRKIIFVGDPYQLQLGRNDESPLNPTYLSENYKLNVSSFQLLDKPDFSEINLQALNCVQSIKENLFNSLQFISKNQLTIFKYFSQSKKK